MEKGLAIITGADGGMGQVITAALAKEGYPVIMACLDPEKAASLCNRIQQDTGTTQIAYMLTRQLLPLMQPGCRIVNTVSCTYAIGRIEPDFFEKGRNGRFFRIPVYSNTKLALLLFTQELAERLQNQGITINASDPGIVSTNMITMQAWFDPLTDILFRPFIKTPVQGAATAIHLALSDEAKDRNGCCYANCKKRNVSERIRHHAQQKQLWDDTEILLRQKGIRF